MKSSFRLVCLICFLLLTTLPLASDVGKIEKKIIMNMIHSLNHNALISIYTDSQKIKNLLSKHKVNFVDSCSNAKVAILETKKAANVCNHIPILTLKYNLLKFYSSSVASFFWQKGRPNIVFIESRLKKQNISIDSEFNDFIEESIW